MSRAGRCLRAHRHRFVRRVGGFLLCWVFSVLVCSVGFDIPAVLGVDLLGLCCGLLVVLRLRHPLLSVRRLGIPFSLLRIGAPYFLRGLSQVLVCAGGSPAPYPPRVCVSYTRKSLF